MTALRNGHRDLRGARTVHPCSPQWLFDIRTVMPQGSADECKALPPTVSRPTARPHPGVPVADALPDRPPCTGR